MEGIELVNYAKEKASEGVDLFALLGVDATTPNEDIHKAWRRTALKHHPDKAGANYDATLYESFGRARDVLLDPEARAAYSKVVSAAMQKKAQLEQMSSRRRQLVEDLERREAEARDSKKLKTEQRPAHDPERAAMAARGRAKMEEHKRLVREAEERDRLREQERQRTFEAENPGAPSATMPTTEATAAEAEVPTRSHGSTPVPPANHPGQAATAPAQPGGDEYDERIAELERRIRERKEEKLRRKEGKKARKGGTGAQTLEAGADVSIAGTREAGAEAPFEQAPAPSSSDGPKADAPFTRPPLDASSKLSTNSGGGGPAATAAPSSGSGNPFASTMARLRAAQAQRDEEKRRRAETEAT